MRSHINWGGEQNTLYKGVETFRRVLKTLKGSPKGKAKEDRWNSELSSLEMDIWLFSLQEFVKPVKFLVYFQLYLLR